MKTWTLNIREAAKFLKMSVSALGEKARTGEIKAAKPGKSWVFLESDLVAHLDSLYARTRQAPLSGCDEEKLLCHSTNAAISIGLVSPLQMESEYDALLRPATRSKPRSTKTD